MTRVSVAIAVGLFGWGLLITPVSAFEQNVPTKVMILKFGGAPVAGTAFEFVAKDTAGASLLKPGDDPAETGGSLVVSAESGNLTCALADQPFDGIEGWKGIGSPSGAKGYKYINKSAPTGIGGPCTLVMVKNGLIKIKTAGTGALPIPVAEGNPDIELALTLGVDSYHALCAAPHQKEVPDRLVKAVACSLVRSGDGTVADTAEELVWETKDFAGGLHDADTTLAWAGTCPEGTFCQPTEAAAAACAAQYTGEDISTSGCITCDIGPCDVTADATIWELAALLNTEDGAGFAGRDRWRMPEIEELEQLADDSQLVPPLVANEFVDDCAPGCVIPDCSCSALSYWSATPVEGEPDMAWVMDFGETDTEAVAVSNADGSVAAAVRRKQKATKKKATKKKAAGGRGVGQDLLKSGCFRTFRDRPTVEDTCNNFEWEKKDGYSGSPDASNLHDADNRYAWAGRCSVSGAICQPTAAAAAECASQTGGAVWCDTCGTGEGPCDVNDADPQALATIWEWIVAVNAEDLGGHDDWRLPTSGGTVDFPTGDPAELESLIATDRGFCAGGSYGFPCFDPILGPLGSGDFGVLAALYWSASESPAAGASLVNFLNADVPNGGFLLAAHVRAVRDMP